LTGRDTRRAQFACASGQYTSRKQAEAGSLTRDKTQHAKTPLPLRRRSHPGLRFKRWRGRRQGKPVRCSTVNLAAQTLSIAARLDPSIVLPWTGVYCISHLQCTTGTNERQEQPTLLSSKRLPRSARNTWTHLCISLTSPIPSHRTSDAPAL
jgi:hypothetical protein